MIFINVSNLACKTNAELLALIRQATESLRYINVADPEYAATVSIIEIMRRTLAARQMRGPKF